LIVIAQLMIIGGLGLVVLGNVAGLLGLTPAPQGWELLLPVPGMLLWPAALALPRLLAAAATDTDLKSYRLTYDAPEDWPDEKARKALANLAHRGSFGLTWARDQEGTGCWLCVPESDETVLRRLVADMFPTGQVEADPLPVMGDGVIVLRWQAEPPPAHELCWLAGIEGVYYHHRSPDTAVVALWGPQAAQVATRFARQADILAEPARTLRRPRFVGEDPWPNLPAFPASQDNPGLISVARLAQMAPGLRVNGSRGLVLGHDREGQHAGFPTRDLDGLQSAAIWGHAAEAVAINLAKQAVQAELPVLFLDGRGSAAAQLGRRLFREVATGKVLVCDTERPARSHFRLNPLWLPDTVAAWPAILNTIWMAWLRELGVTLAGLGKDAFRHTRVAVILTALAAAQQSLALDVAGLRDALETPDFLGMLDRETLAHAGVLDTDMWQWWLSEGRQTPKFDLRLRLGHLRDRLNVLLDLPEYEMLWQPPYFDPPGVAAGKKLFWRFSKTQGRLQPYVSSQLAAIATLLHVWPRTQPILVFVHELPLGHWAKLLRSAATVRLVVSGQRMHTAPERSDTLLLSRLHQDDVQQLWPHLDGIRAADLRRLADTQLLVRRGSELGAIEIGS
jgi:hypothetical protein